MNNSRPVYSTDGPRIKPPNKPGKVANKSSAPPASVPDDGLVRLFRERGSRGGKTVTVIRGLPAADVEARAVELKRLCGAGGTVKERVIEIQGDHRERIAAKLRALGYSVKLAGG